MIRNFVDAKNRFFKGQCKYPRFKAAKKTLPSLNYTLRGFSIKSGRLKVAGGVSVPVVWSRELPSTPSSVRIYQDAVGWWWASFVVETPQEKNTPHAEEKVIGIDWGVAQPATTTDADFNLEYSGRLKNNQSRLTKEQRKMSLHRRSQDWESYAKAKKRAAKIHRTVRWQRQEQSRAWAQDVAKNFSHVAVEDFKPRFLSRSRMAKKATENSVGMVKRELVSACEKSGSVLFLVDPRFTSMDCSFCGARAKHRLELDVRVFDCVVCGVSLDRDVNAARNMVIRAGFNPADVDDVIPVNHEVSRFSESGIPRL